MALLQFSSKGIYCAQGKFYIDPWKPVNYALTTHGHADHVKTGSAHYLCHTLTKPVLQSRYGLNDEVQTLSYNESITINGVQVSFHPAGHVIGSAQIRLEYKGEIWVVSGDYKTEYDGISTAFEPVKCHHFITESTFGLPIYQWAPQQSVFKDIQNWVHQNIEQQKTSILSAYSLGKAQRLVQNLQSDRPIYVHSSINKLQMAFESQGLKLPQVKVLSENCTKAELQQAILIVPPAITDSKWVKTLINPVVGVCSGWMQVRAARRWRSADAGFALSDHADWKGLLQAISATEAEHIYITHGYTSTLSKYLTELGLDAKPVQTQYGTEDDIEA